MNGDGEVLAEICSTPSFSNVDRMAIYGNAYYARLIETLAGDYEAIHTLLGDEEFEKLCRHYIHTYPSKYFTLRWFGQFMAEYLRHNEPYSQHEYLVEMAKFEWTFTDAFDAQDIFAVTESDITQIPLEAWPTLIVRFHPSVHCFDYQWNILPIWKAIKDDEEVPELQKLGSIETCLIWRQELTTRYRTLEENESLLLKAAIAGKNFADWCELLLNAGEAADEVPMVAASILKTWIGSGMVCEFLFKD